MALRRDRSSRSSRARFSVTGLRTDLLLAAGFLIWSLSTVAFAIVPVLEGGSVSRADGWAAARRRHRRPGPHRRRAVRRRPQPLRDRALRDTVAVAAIAARPLWVLLRAHGGALPALTALPGGRCASGPRRRRSRCRRFSTCSRSSAGAAGSRGRETISRSGSRSASRCSYSPLCISSSRRRAARRTSPRATSSALLAFGLMLVGAWRAIRSAELGRAVAEERARVAREIHDGLAQYLFAVSTHAQMLEAGAPVDEVGPQLKQAAALAQQEARFAILALSSASGTAPFDSALRRYVEFLTADGELAVDLEIDPAIRLAPDEQIEIFRIVQEGLGNVRRHANATSAEVVIGRRPSGERFVAIEDDGEGFTPEAQTAGHGLRNMRARALSIDGGLNVRSTPGSRHRARGRSADVNRHFQRPPLRLESSAVGRSLALLAAVALCCALAATAAAGRKRPQQRVTIFSDSVGAALELGLDGEAGSSSREPRPPRAPSVRPADPARLPHRPIPRRASWRRTRTRPQDRADRRRLHRLQRRPRYVPPRHPRRPARDAQARGQARHLAHPAARSASSTSTSTTRSSPPRGSGARR